MSSPRHRLDLLLKKTKRLRRLDSSVVRDVIATTRELIEAHKAQSKFPIATLYCNWSLHNQIAGSLTALRCLADISRRLQGSTKGANVDSFLQFLSEQVFRIDVLRSELLALSKEHDLSDYLFSLDHNWAVFSSLLLEGLVGKRLRYPPGADLPSDPSDSQLLRNAKRLLGEVRTLTSGQDRQQFKAAWVTLAIDPWDERPEHDKSPIFHCNIEAFDGVTFALRMNNALPLPAADSYSLSP